MENNNIKKEELHEYHLEVYLGPCTAIQKIVRGKSLEGAIAYLKKEYGYEKVVSVGDDKSIHKVEHKERDCNDIVHRLNRLYYGGR